MHLLGAMTIYVQHLDGVWYVCHHEPRNFNGREPGLTSMARNCHILPMPRQHMQHNLSAESFHPFSHRSRPVWQTRMDGTNSPSKRATVANSILFPSPTSERNQYLVRANSSVQLQVSGETRGWWERCGVVEDGVRLGGLRLLARGRLRAGMYCSRHSKE